MRPTTQEFIEIKGASENNLQHVSLSIPKNKIVVFTGVSGSGKSSLVFDTVYAESQRQLLETWSMFSRARLPKIEKPQFESISGICPSIVIDQRRLGNNSRSTVGTVSELYGLLRALYAKAGDPHSPCGANLFSFNKPEGMCMNCRGLGVSLVVDEEELIDWNISLRRGAIQHADYRVGGWFWRQLAECGLFDLDKPVNQFTEEELDQLLYSPKVSVSVSSKKGKNKAKEEASFEGIVTALKRRRLMRESGPSAVLGESVGSDYQTTSTSGNGHSRLSSARTKNDGKFFKFVECSECNGDRLNPLALSVKIQDHNISQVSRMELNDLYRFLQSETLYNEFTAALLDKLLARLRVLCEIGVGYLTLSRAVGTLSGGECQRVKMAKQLGCDLVSMCYVLDEPTVGLHPRDMHKLVNVLRELRDRGNSVLVVEHEPVVILGADYIFDLGPKAGSEGGTLIFQGTVSQLLDTVDKSCAGLTAQYLAPRPRVRPRTRRVPREYVEIRGANIHNLKNVSLSLPLGLFVCVTGVAGSGKSSLIRNVFARQCPLAVVIDQSPVGRSSRSNPATYTGAFDYIRKEFERATGESASSFSFNSSGACSKCRGLGKISLEMHFLETVRVTCDECMGLRFSEHVLEFEYAGKNIAECLDMTIADIKGFFESMQGNKNIKQILKRLGVLEDVGLGYLKLGQSVSTLSGGEAQRLKLASELHKSDSIVIMDEPTTGLHMADIHRLMGIIQRLVDSGNTVVVIEHNLDVALQSDWMIDMGPEGGSKGGMIIGQGTPEHLATVKESHTGKFLRELIETVDLSEEERKVYERNVSNEIMGEHSAKDVLVFGCDQDDDESSESGDDSEELVESDIEGYADESIDESEEEHDIPVRKKRKEAPSPAPAIRTRRRSPRLSKDSST